MENANQIFDDGFDPLQEYEKLVRRMVNAVGQCDFRMPADYVRAATEEAITTWRNYSEGAFEWEKKQPNFAKK